VGDLGQLAQLRARVAGVEQVDGEVTDPAGVLAAPAGAPTTSQSPSVRRCSTRSRPTTPLAPMTRATFGRVSVEEAAAAHGIRLAQHTILQMLDAVGPASQQALSDELRIDRSTMVRCIGALEKAGHVQRHRDAVDRRAYSVHITESGRTLLADAEQEVPGVLDQTLAPLSEGERSELTRLLAKLVTGTPH
jgi:DNA-binding MarR family transcriptional regulator